MEGEKIKLRLETPSRLHFGIIDMRGDLGRIHGSVGVAIDKPKLVLEASKSKKLEAFGPRSCRIKKFAEVVLKQYKIKKGVKFVQLSVIPEHVGYGSGTQLALAVGTLISELFELEVTVEELSNLLGRARISGIGTHVFKQGGFIVDGGRNINTPNTVPPLIFRASVPGNWFFVIGMPEISARISGKKEKDAFTKMEPPSESIINYVSRIVLTKMIPSIIEKDIRTFGESMTQLDYKFGEHFVEIQGGIFSHPDIEKGIEFLLDSGVFGAGQSSWGPIFYGLVEGEKQAIKTSKKLSDYLKENGIKAKISYTSADNEGAQISYI